MRINKLILNNFRAFKYAEIDFDDFNCIIGKNDTGKSTILAALEWFFDSKKNLDENDFAAASFDWSEYELPASYDEITGVTYSGETVKEFNYVDLCISVDVCFSDVIIQNRTEDGSFIFSKDFISKEGNLCIRKYMYHPFIDPFYDGTPMGYHINKHYFEKVGKPFSDCSIEELKTAYNEIGKNANDLCKDLHQLEEECKSKKRGIALSAIKAKIRDEEAKIKEKISSELYNHYISIGERICDTQGKRFENLDHLEFQFGLTFPKYILYTSKTPINDYLNALFTPFNASQVYKSIEKAKIYTARKLSEFLNFNGENDNLYIKENEKIDLFTQDSLVFKQNDLPLRIPLKNKGEGLQLKIKNAVFRLLTETQTKNQINTIFAFEEPETHLHPSAQIEMYETIKVLSEKSNYQVIITTHSPYIVKELAQNNTLPIIVKQEESAQESSISKLDERILPYVSMNEINFIAFDEPSIEYHIELFGYIHNRLVYKYENDNGFKTYWDSSIVQPNKNGVMVAIQVTTIKAVDAWLCIKCAANKYKWFDSSSFCEEQRSLPYCVRNNIDHPLIDDVSNLRKHNAYLNNCQFNNKDLIRKSIEFMRNAIINNMELR